MATTVHEQENIKLIDGTEITTRPLKISLLKPFMKKFEGLAEVSEDNEKSMDVLLDCVQIALKQYKPELSEDRDALEEAIDLPTVYKIIEVASGIKMTDPTALLNAVTNK
jgi:hypothetical protein